MYATTENFAAAGASVPHISAKSTLWTDT